MPNISEKQSCIDRLTKNLENKSSGPCFLGIDIACVDRFSGWKRFSDKRLSKIFKRDELRVYRQRLAQSLSRGNQFLASRFALKEAFFKAYSNAVSQYNLPKMSFFVLARAISISGGDGSFLPMLGPLPLKTQKFSIQASLAHEHCYATAIVSLVLLTQ